MTPDPPSPPLNSTLSRRSFFSDLHKRRRDDSASSSPGSAFQIPSSMKRREVELDVSGSPPPQFRFLEYSGDKSLQDRFISTNMMESYDCESSNRDEVEEAESTGLRFFIKMIDRGKSMTVHADRNDTVRSLHQRIERMTRIPVIEQRLIYCGKQLQYEQCLGDYLIGQNSVVQLTGRMRSTKHPMAWQLVDDIMFTVCRMCKGEPLREGIPNINGKLTAFFNMIPEDNNDYAAEYFHIFSDYSLPTALATLYSSSLEPNKAYAKSAIKFFISSCSSLPIAQQNHCLPVLLEFCKLLRNFRPQSKFYKSCRSSLSSILESIEDSGGLKHENQQEWLSFANEIFPFITELADHLVKDLSQTLGPTSTEVGDFSTFLHLLEKASQYQVGFKLPIDVNLQNGVTTHPVLSFIGRLHGIFKLLLTSMDNCLGNVESWLSKRGAGNSENMPVAWFQYVAILKIINSISKFFQGAKEQLAGILKTRKASFCALVLSFSKRADDKQWIFEYKEATNFEVRRHLVMMMFPDVKEEFGDLHEMLVDRSNLLAESFAYISGASPKSLHGGLFMEFKNEEATGPGVLREWFFLVCQEIFNQKNTLFIRSLDDCRRFSPNPASKIDPMHLKFFEFTGRVVALALMHKVQVGVLFDRVFFLQLAGLQISLEDIRDTDRIMYTSCKQILEMDPEIIDSDCGLGLTFVIETEELGKRTTSELCYGGKYISVNSKNRDQYVNLLIQHRFVKSVSDQVLHFSRGFKDILSESIQHSSSFFNCLDSEDLDWMLRGGENPISIEDWKTHTLYNGYKETDCEIDWFWKIMKDLTDEQLKNLLYFWTSIKFLPVEGFKGLSSKLYIFRSYESPIHLPSAHTCFYRLCLPKYPTFALMEQRLKVITQVHVSSSFGTS